MNTTTTTSSMIKLDILPDPQNGKIIMFVENSSTNEIIEMNIMEDDLDWDYEDYEEEEMIHNDVHVSVG